MTAPKALIVAPEGPALTPWEKAYFAALNPWGFILFARNLDTPDQIRALCAELRGCVGRDAPILIDQEGGRVQRLRAPLWREWPAPLDLGAGARDPARAIYLQMRIIAAELLALGITVNCAPTCDIAQPGTHPFLRNRCYGQTAEAAASQARAAAEGLLDGGVLPVMKHMPGHGRGLLDSHLETPKVNAALEHLENTDFLPFQALSDLPLGMTAHVDYAALDPGVPGTVSAKVIGVIRDKIGFDGFLMTDDIGMEALGGSVASRAQRALAAGVDAVLHCSGKRAEIESLDAIAPMTAKAQARANAALAQRKTPDSVDIDALFAEFEALI